jgi:uncharacterized membrane protein HdeD (DUF308 family)
MSDNGTVGTLKRASGWAIAWAILIIFVGILAISLPLVSGIGVTIVIGWLFVVAGIFHLVEAFHTKGTGAFFWRLLVGIVYVIGGFYLAWHPTYGLLWLTLWLGIILIIQGVFAIIGFFAHRKLPGAGWILFNGICALLLGLLIWWDGPRAAVWVIGTLVGINLIFSGVTRLMLWSSVHKSLSA